MVLQECGLLPEWAEKEFAASFRTACKDVAGGNNGARNPRKMLFIPAGDVHDTNDDPPPSTDILPCVALMHLQGDRDSCLRDSLASALAFMGFGSEAKQLAADAALVGCNLNLVQRTSALLQRLFAKSNLVMKKLYTHPCLVSDIAGQDAAWPILLILQTSDGCSGSHAVTTWNHMIFDSNSSHALRWSQQALDWCSGKNSACVGFCRARRICPRACGETLPNSIISVGLQLRTPASGDSTLFGWIKRLPAEKKKDHEVQHTDGATARLSKDNVASCVLQSSTVGENHAV
jgi:hypothetical protein